MKRIIDYYLLHWKHYEFRKPLLLRGARQVGKTFAVRKLGETYDNFVEINLEFQLKIRPIFEKTFDPHEIINDISIALQQPIIPGKTLLFIDEIQMVPQAITALRYFHEMMPDLHVIGATAKLEEATQKVGCPVGRIQFLHMHPVSFIEFLASINTSLFKNLLESITTKNISSIFETQLSTLIKQYQTKYNYCRQAFIKNEQNAYNSPYRDAQDFPNHHDFSLNPLYAVAKVMSDYNLEMREAIENL